jgi:hypothetical protein
MIRGNKMTDNHCFEPYGDSGYCVHSIPGLYTNWIYCGLSIRNDQAHFEICQQLRNTGRCLHP